MREATFNSVPLFSGRHLRFFWVMAAALLLLSSCSCAPKVLAQITILEPSACARPVVEGPIALCAAPIENGPECESYFGIDILAKGYLPVRFSAENRGEPPILLNLGSFLLAGPEGSVEPTPPDKVYEDLKASVGGRTAAWGIAFGVFAGIAAYECAKNRNEALGMGLFGNLFNARTLSQGQVAKGILYFKLPAGLASKIRKGRLPLSGVRLRVATGSGQTPGSVWIPLENGG